MIARVMLLLVALVSAGAQAQEIKESYAFAVLGEPKYAFNFDHFDYVNPAAPKGGQMTLSAIGTFDNFNRYSLRGNPGVRTEALYDTLFTTSDDEPGSYYPLIADHAAMPPTIPGWKSRLIPALVFTMARPLPPAMWPLPFISL